MNACICRGVGGGWAVEQDGGGLRQDEREAGVDPEGSRGPRLGGRHGQRHHRNRGLGQQVRLFP